MADHLENGTYLLDESERQTYTVAARMLDRVDRRLDLGQPLADFDYLLLMCAHLILTGEQGVDETLAVAGCVVGAWLATWAVAARVVIRIAMASFIGSSCRGGSP